MSRYRKRIDELSPDETRRELYHREPPPVVESDYMTNPKEIRQKAKASLQKLEQDENYRYLRRKEKTLTPQQIEATYIRYLVAYVRSMEAFLAVGRNLDLFYYCFDVATPEEYGKRIIQESGHFDYDPNLDAYYDYRKYGEDRIRQEQGVFLEHG